MSDGVKGQEQTGANKTVQRIIQFAQSEVFERVFEEGMSLVEQTASYLDGPGREESRELVQGDALRYATVSMETTTRLMQAASWLVVLRAVREEDMSAHEAADEKYRLDDEAVDTLTERDETALPAGLVALVTEARTLFTRICRLDREIFQDTSDEETQPGSIRGQLDALQSAAASGVFDPLSVWRRG